MLSWRYVGHPQAGGAEVLTHEVLRRMAGRGWDVTCFTALYPGAAREEERDGVRLVRRGRQWSVHAHAFRWLRRRLSDFDVVVDQTNTIPFLTPLYVPRWQRRLFICQLAREYWFRETRGALRLLAPIGYAMEPAQLQLYRRTPTVTISESSRADLARFGIRDITVIPMAIDTVPLPELGHRAGPLRLIIIGRLTPAKFVEEGLRVFAKVQARHPEAVLDVVGGGDDAYRTRLLALCDRLELRGVTFHGRVGHERKLELLGAAHLHVFTSHREGWGLTVSEAAAMGTPTVGYDAPGVRDSIGEAHLLAPIGDVDALADRALAFVSAPAAEREMVRRLAWERASAMSWQGAADAFEQAVR